MCIRGTNRKGMLPIDEVDVCVCVQLIRWCAISMVVTLQIIQTPGLWESDATGFHLGANNSDAGDAQWCGGC